MSEGNVAAYEKLAFLVQMLEERGNSFQKRAVWYRWRYYLSTMTTVVLSALITVIAGCRPDFGTAVNNLTPHQANDFTNSIEANLTLGLAALSTVVAAWGAFFSPRESWLLYFTTCGRLRALQAKVAFNSRHSIGGNDQAHTVNAWFKEYQDILEAHNATWLQMRSSGSAVVLTRPSPSASSP
jgi:hypothetical protein